MVRLGEMDLRINNLDAITFLPVMSVVSRTRKVLGCVTILNIGGPRAHPGHRAELVSYKFFLYSGHLMYVVHCRFQHMGTCGKVTGMKL